MNKCPHCGKPLSEVGVIELSGYIEYPDENGNIPFDNRRNKHLDDTEGYLCGHCSGGLNWYDDDGYTHILGEGEE